MLKLSDLMSYMLYESGASLVPLDKEISNLENYIELEKLRFGRRLSLSFEQQGSTKSVRIPPLLLLAFVENSFKHGMNQTIGDGRIGISLNVQPEWLLFSVSNPAASTVNPPEPLSATPATSSANPGISAAPSRQEASEEKNGIGLKNVVRRLDLLYGGHYQLDLSNEAGAFHVTLKIPLP